MKIDLAGALLLAAVLAAACWGPLPTGNSFPGGDRVALCMLELRFAVHLSREEDGYRLAERYYEAGDCEKSLLLCESVLRRNPRQAPACALRMELEFILGMGKASASPTEDYSKYMHGNVISGGQLVIEIDNALARADRNRVQGDPDGAIRELRKVNEFMKWMPGGIEMESRKVESRLLMHRLDCERDCIDSGLTDD
jgi:hypothetical protein